MTPSYASSEPIGPLVAELIEDGRAVISSEIAVVKARGNAFLAAAKVAAALGAVALLLAIGAIVALLVGLMMALAVVTGPLLAALIVAGVTLALAGLLGWLAARQFAAHSAKQAFTA